MTKVIIYEEELYPVPCVERDIRESSIYSAVDVPEEILVEWEQAYETFTTACSKIRPYIQRRAGF